MNRAEDYQTPIQREQGIFLSLVGPAGSGKSTLGAKLLELFPDTLKLSISVTSRDPRAGEIPGQSYEFISRTEFEAREQAGFFFEWEETHGNLYGTPQKTIDEVLAGTTDLLLDVDIRGAIRFKKSFPKEAVNVFLLPASSSVLRERLLRREQGNQEEVARRMKTAEREYRQLLDEGKEGGCIDYVVVNDSLDRAFHQVCSILFAERSRLARMSASCITTRFS